VNVGEYRCVTVEVATTLIDADEFSLGSVVSDPAGTDPVPGTWYVIGQDPTPGQKVPKGTAINLTAQEIDPGATCP
jgi:beta-lactam-binding protein with PASTA domain